MSASIKTESLDGLLAACDRLANRQGRQVEQQALEVMGPQIILGAKPCDMKSVELIDKVFLAEPVDSLYQEKHQKTILVTNACHESGETYSCHEFGITPVASAADLVMQRGSGDEIFLTSQTAKGDALVEELLALGSFTVDEPSPLPAGICCTRHMSGMSVS